MTKRKEIYLRLEEVLCRLEQEDVDEPMADNSDDDFDDLVDETEESDDEYILQTDDSTVLDYAGVESTEGTQPENAGVASTQACSELELGNEECECAHRYSRSPEPEMQPTFQPSFSNPPETMPVEIPDAWTSTLTPVTIHDFVTASGPRFIVSTEPEDIFAYLFTDALLDEIVLQTNRYAKEQMDPLKYNKWETISAQEMRAYLGFCILMGMVKLPEIEDYWKADPYFHYAPVASRISRERFRDITRYLHFADNTHLRQRGDPAFDRLGKVRPVIDAVSHSVASKYAPSRDIVVDEAMIPFQGRSTLKQYLPLKPVKRGIKVWCLGDSTNGYIHNFQVYTGRADTDRDEEFGLGARVVLSLTEPLHGRHHHVYCDNFFTSAALLINLLQNGTYGCGTVRQNSKDFPPDLKLPGKGKKAMQKLGLYNR